MKHYTRLTQNQGYQICVYMKTGLEQTQRANFVGFDKSTASRALRGNQGKRGYRRNQADSFCVQRRQDKSKPSIGDATWLLREGWRFEQFRLWRRQQAGLQFTRESIYQYMPNDRQASGTLYRHLRWQKHRKKRYSAYLCQGQIRNRVFIDQRLAIVDQGWR